jgi:hypothetical protein
MASSTSYTAAATSDIDDRLQQAVDHVRVCLSPERRLKLEQAVARFRDLHARGLIKRQTFMAPTADDMRRFYEYKSG